MTPEDMMARGRRVTEELFNQGDLAVVDELIDPGYAEHLVADGRTISAGELKDRITDLRRACPDLYAHTEEQVVEGDTLVQRLTVTGTQDAGALDGEPPAGRRMQVSVVDISRVGGLQGRFVERWTLTDQLAVLRQLGRLTAAATARAEARQ